MDTLPVLVTFNHLFYISKYSSKNQLTFTERDDLSAYTNDYESMWIEIDSPKQNDILCSVFYRHPNTSLNSFLKEFYKTLDITSKESKFCIIMEDFNINLINYESHHTTEEYVNTLNSYSFQPLITHPTRITYHSATLIDNIFFNSLEHYTLSGNILTDLTDHLPNFVIINKICVTNTKNKTHKRDFSMNPN